jgi:hypothetical protein
MLLAGHRKGNTIAVKEKTDGERWVTRHVNTFCPRLFSAIRLPDEVLGSRSIIVPLIRSSDPRRAKASCLDQETWPEHRQCLVDDLWSVALVHLPQLPSHDRRAAAGAELSGRNLDPWRPILAVAHWLQEEYDVSRQAAGEVQPRGLYDRLELLSRDYQAERGEFEDGDRTRVLFRALLQVNADPEGLVWVRPKQLAEAMKTIALAEDLAEPDKPFTTARQVGWLLKRQRFRKGDRDELGVRWRLTRQEVEAAARAYGVEVPGDGTNAEATTGPEEVPF